PTEQEDEGADNDVAEVVSRDGVRSPALVELADTGPEQHRERERREPPGCMDDARAGEIDRAVAEVKGLAQVSEPASAPHPVAEDRIDDGPDSELCDDQPGERDALGDG